MQASFLSARAFFTKKSRTPGSHTRAGSVDSTSSRLTTRSRRRLKETVTASECDLPIPSTEMQAQKATVREPERETVATVAAVERPVEKSAVLEEVKSMTDYSQAELSPPFEGLTHHTLDLTADSAFFDDDYLASAFGITMDREIPVEKDDDVASSHESHGPSYRDTIILPSLNKAAPLSGPSSPTASMSEESSSRPMSLSLHPSQSRKRSQGVVLSMIEEAENLEATSQPHGTGTIGLTTTKSAAGTTGATATATSPRAPKIRHKPKPLTGLATAQLSVVSPLSSVQMPKPQRPFSTLSIEGMAKEPPQTPPMSKSANSTSSEDTNENDAKSDYGHSPSSSMSSMASEPSSMFADRLYAADSLSPPGPRLQSKGASTASLHSPDRPTLRARRSVSSLKSTYSVCNVNKPLPPEPGRAPAGQQSTPGSANVSRSSSVTVRQRTKSTSKASDEAKPALDAPSRSASRSSVTNKLASLRSKYTPRDLDALDDAFQKTGVAKAPPPPAEPAVDAAIEVPPPAEHALSTIAEASPRQSTVPVPRNEPIQVSRGPMRMEPGRKAPQPPSNPPTLPPHQSPSQPPGASPGSEFRRRFTKRSQPGNHVALQMKQLEPQTRRRASTTATTRSSANKANRILGKSSEEAPTTRLERRASVDSTWSVADSTSLFAPSEAATEDKEEVEGEATPDAQVEEIRRRLELLRPKDDPSITCHTFHQNNSTRLPVEPVKLSYVPTPRYTIDQYKAREQPLEIKIHEHIAELEAHREPSPVELDGTQWAQPAELPQPSPAVVSVVVAPSRPSDDASEEAKDIVAAPPDGPKRSPSVRLAKTKARKHCSLASIAMSDIPDLHDVPTPPTEGPGPSLSPEEVEELISADAAERVLLRILQSLDNLKDLFAAAEVSRGFYRTFKKNELALLRNALWKMSPAAWELREVSLSTTGSANEPAKYKPNLYFRHYVRDLLAMVELKAMILDNCKSFLRQDTIEALAGETERSLIIDDAFWRVWTFCQIFGCGKDREDDIVGQMDWLRGGPLARQSTNTRTIALLDNLKMNTVLYNPPIGFARGNCGGLSVEELYDMTEIWNCMGVLVAGYLGRREEAREYGIFDSANIPPGDVEKENQTLEEWTHYLLTLTPATILDVTSPTTPTHTTFAHVRSLGYTHWIAPSVSNSRSTFLKEAVARVYKERMALQRPIPTHSPSFSSLQVADEPTTAAAAAIAASRSTTPTPGAPEGHIDPSAAARHRCAQHAVEIRAKRNDVSYRDVPVSEERPMSNYPEVLAALDSLPSNVATPAVPAVPKLPSLVNKLSFRMPKSASTVFPSPPSARSSSRAARPAPLVGTNNTSAEPRRGKRVKRPARNPGEPNTPGTDSPTLPVGEDPFAAAAAAAAAASATPKKDRTSRMSSIRKGFAAAAAVSSSPSKRAHRNARGAELPASSPASVSSPALAPASTSAATNATTNTNGPWPAPTPATIILDDEKQLVESGTQPHHTQPYHPHRPHHLPPLSSSRHQQSRGASAAGVLDPVDRQIERLVNMGFEVERVKAALAETETGHAVDGEKALAKLMREREKKRRLERLQRMG